MIGDTLRNDRGEDRRDPQKCRIRIEPEPDVGRQPGGEAKDHQCEFFGAEELEQCVLDHDGILSHRGDDYEQSVAPVEVLKQNVKHAVPAAPLWPAPPAVTPSAPPDAVIEMLPVPAFVP